MLAVSRYDTIAQRSIDKPASVKYRVENLSEKINKPVKIEKRLVLNQSGVMPPSSDPLPVCSAAELNRKRKKDQVNKTKEVKKEKVEKNSDMDAAVHRLTRKELEELVLKKVVEAVTAQSKYVELGRM